MRNSFWYIFLATGLLAPTGLADPITPIEDAIVVQKLDADGNGKLDIVEVGRGVLFRLHPEKFDLDAKLAKEADLEKASAEDPAFRAAMARFIANRGPKLGYKLEEISAAKDLGYTKPPVLPPAIETVPPSRLLLRKDRDSLPGEFTTDDKVRGEFAKDKDAKNLAKKGAFFSYGRHFESSTDQWTAEGILAYEIPGMRENFGMPSPTRWLLYGEFARIDFGGDIARDKTALGLKESSKISPSFKSSESNSLKLGAEFQALLNWPKPGPFYNGLVVRAGAAFQTDWDFESQIPSGYLELSPLFPVLGFGSFNTSLPWLWWRLDLSVHADILYVSNEGRWTKSKEGDFQAHIGPKVALTLIPFQNMKFFQNLPLVLDASFAQYDALTNDSLQVRKVTADATFYLKKAEGEVGTLWDPFIGITLSYKYLDDVENEIDDNALLLGVSVGF